MNEKYNGEIFISRARGEEAYAGEPKIRELKNFCLKVKKCTRQVAVAKDPSIQRS